MLLAVDVGNTHIAIGLCDGERLIAHWRLSTRHDRTADEVGIELAQLFDLNGLKMKLVEAVAIASVVPSFNVALVEASRRYFDVEPLMIEPGVRTGVRIRYENPKEVGADRIANVVAALHRYGAPAIVIDFGTAVTYDAISGDGDYLGGAIAPGIQISLEVLVAQTALLHRVEPVAPDTVIGKNTVAAIQAGLIWGFVSQVEGMVARMKAELGGEVRVVATGGQAEMLAGLTTVIDTVDPLLTLEGLRLIHLLNQ